MDFGVHAILKKQTSTLLNLNTISMKCFHCAKCGSQIFFENDRCLGCGSSLGMVPETLELCALEKVAEDQWRPLGTKSDGKIYRPCANSKQSGVCNWLVPMEDANVWCLACRLNEVIPDLVQPKNLARWKKLELAKRRCIYTFNRLGLPVQNEPGGQRAALRFKFLEDKDGVVVKTGHENGVITINIAEADDDERERRRVNLHEPYRTLVGHIRHESGHYFWDLLLENSPELPRFRELFGDETVAYDKALESYYQQGPPLDWMNKAITPYACSHPWEDWAESWAHYLHIVDTLDTAANFGISIKENVPPQTEPVTIIYNEDMDFERLLTEWTPLTCTLNVINRGMGLADIYPFVITPPAIEKLRFIHDLILKVRKAGQPK